MDPGVGHLNGILARVGGNLKNNFQKSQMPGGLPPGGGGYRYINLPTLSSIQHQAYILDVHVRCTTSETSYSVKISVAWATQLHRLIG